MFERERFGWLLGRPALSDGAVGWTGVAIFPDFFVNVNTAADLDTLFRARDTEVISAFGCTSSENLIASLKSDIAPGVASKIVDLSLAMRIASGGDEPEKSPKRTVDLLAECGGKGSVPESLEAPLLEGRTNYIGNFQEVDTILRSLVHRLAQLLRKAGEFRRYVYYELPAHRELLAQSRFRLLVDTEGLAAVASELSSKLRADRLELVTRHALDPVDFTASFEARKAFAKRHLGVCRERLTLSEFRDLLGEHDEPTSHGKTKGLLASFLRNDASRRSLITLATADGAGCQVMYDPIGTSTGRVVMRSPGVQWLEKKHRKHILTPEGFEPRYLDYSCFEPTILAAVSGDAELLAACASDVYERVGEWLGFDGAASRDLAKSIMLRFIYGQSQGNLVATLSAEARLAPEDAQLRLEHLRHRLSQVFEFRSELEARASANGYMETREGNRCLVKEGESFKALSHYLQGTGSLIFKRALVGIFGGQSGARLVVPMHDAFLCAFPTESLEDCLQFAVAAMRSSFLWVVGVDLARVSVRKQF